MENKWNEYLELAAKIFACEVEELFNDTEEKEVLKAWYSEGWRAFVNKERNDWEVEFDKGLERDTMGYCSVEELIFDLDINLIKRWYHRGWNSAKEECNG